MLSRLLEITRQARVSVIIIGVNPNHNFITLNKCETHNKQWEGV
jgi:hypothetical protein